MTQRDPDTAWSRPAPFCVVLTPYRSLSRAGFTALMVFIGLVGFVAGVAFAMIGAWPVLGFFGLDVALIWLAFHLNYRSGRQMETVAIEDGLLTLTQTDPRGRAGRTDLAALWVDVRLREAADGRTTLALASHGREHRIAAFLTDDERRDLALLLQSALLEARGGPRI